MWCYLGWAGFASIVDLVLFMFMVLLEGIEVRSGLDRVGAWMNVLMELQQPQIFGCGCPCWEGGRAPC